MTNAIEIKNLSKKYEGFCLDNINMTVPSGMIVGLIGENGAGKTTTIKSMLGLATKETGEISILGKSIDQEEFDQVKEEIGVILDDSFFSEYLTIQDVGKVMKEFYSTWDDALYQKYIQDFHLPEKKKMKEYSSGMKMKARLAATLAHHPKLLILDEPTNGLDPVARSEILDIFREFIEDEKHSILISSHITSDLEHIADYITFIEEGKIVFSKNKDVLLENFGILKCTEEEFLKVASTDYLRYKKQKYSYEVLVEDRFSFAKKYAFGTMDKPTLEDIMLLYVKGEK